MLLLSDRCGINIAFVVRQQRGHFLLTRLINNKYRAGFGHGLRIFPDDCDSQNQAVGIGSNQKIPLLIERERTRVAFITLIEELALAIRRHREYFAFISGGHE